MCVFEFTGHGGGPRHLHADQDEWIYILEGEFEFHVGGSGGVSNLKELAEKPFRVRAGECVFLPRNVAHVWACMSEQPGKIINVYQPAGQMEEFFRKVGQYKVAPASHELPSLAELRQLFRDHGMKLLGPPLGWDEFLARQGLSAEFTQIMGRADSIRGRLGGGSRRGGVQGQ